MAYKSFEDILNDVYDATNKALKIKVTALDDQPINFGTGSTVKILYETADANANELILVFPEGGAVDVPVFVIGDASIDNVDLGFFNGVTEPTIAIVNDAADAYASLDAGDDAVAGSKGLYFKAAADEDIELLNLSVTGTPRIYWDESEDQFRSTKGWVFDAACDVQGTWVATAAWTLPAFTLSNTMTVAQGVTLKGSADSSLGYWNARGGISAGKGVTLYFGTTGDGYGGGLELSTPNAAGNADTSRLVITGTLATAVATWSAITHTGLKITSAGNIDCAGTGATGWVIKNPKNAAATALSGTQLDVEIDIGGTPYYFTVYPTKA